MTKDNEGGSLQRHGPAAAPVFLVGSERSGSTLLRLMLDHHPEIAFAQKIDFVVEHVSDTGAFQTDSSPLKGCSRPRTPEPGRAGQAPRPRGPNHG